MSPTFRAMLVLMILPRRDCRWGWYGYGDHVSDPRAFAMRVRNILR